MTARERGTAKIKLLKNLLTTENTAFKGAELTDNEIDFIYQVVKRLQEGKVKNRLEIERMAERMFILNVKLVKELIEFATLINYSNIFYDKGANLSKKVFDSLVGAYQDQVIMSARFAETIQLAQYSTPVPISYLMAAFVQRSFINKTDDLYFEPTAGNGSFCLYGQRDKFIVNELDRYRLIALLNTQLFPDKLDYKYVFNFDIVENKDIYKVFNKSFSGVMGNPPFGTLKTAVQLPDYKAKFKNMEKSILLESLMTLKDDGRAAFILGGHWEFDEKLKRPTSDQEFYFISYLFINYNIKDVINVNGQIYSRQGTSYPVRIILIDGRKKVKDYNFDVLFNEMTYSKNSDYIYSLTPVDTLDQLYYRMIKSI